MGILSNFFTILFSLGWEIHSRRVRVAIAVGGLKQSRLVLPPPIETSSLIEQHYRRRTLVDCQMVAIRKVWSVFSGSSNGNKYTVTADFWSQSQCVNDDDDDDGSDQERTTVVAVSNRCEGKFALSPPARNLLIQQLLLCSAF